MIFIVKKISRMLVHMWDSAESYKCYSGWNDWWSNFQVFNFLPFFRNKKCSRTVAILSSHLRLYFGGGYISSKILQWEKDEISLFLLHFNIAWSLRFSAVSVWLWLEWHRFRKFYISKKLFVQLNLRIKLLIFEVQTWKQ